MKLDWIDIKRRGEAGRGITTEEALAITRLEDEEELRPLFEVAGHLRRHHHGDFVNTCGISNAKSGRCPEKCSFCSQSAHYHTEAPVYTTKTAQAIVDEARDAFEHGVREFSIVTSGRALRSRSDLDTIKAALAGIREATGQQTCASLGLMSREHLAELKDAGLESMHHNLETARSHHASIVETHSYDDEVETIRHAKSLGMYVCSGGIFGMGESWDQRVELAADLRNLDVDSVPVNFLNPRPGTPLADTHDLTPGDCLKIIALLRLMLPTKDIVVCGGRELNLGDRQPEIFEAGANGMMLGNYLTTAGQAIKQDFDMLQRLGLQVRPPPHQPLPSSVPQPVRSEGTDRGRLDARD